jgi:hypothetical protein
MNSSILAAFSWSLIWKKLFSRKLLSAFYIQSKPNAGFFTILDQGWNLQVKYGIYRKVLSCILYDYTIFIQKLILLGWVWWKWNYETKDYEKTEIETGDFAMRPLQFEPPATSSVWHIIIYPGSVNPSTKSQLLFKKIKISTHIPL